MIVDLPPNNCGPGLRDSMTRSRLPPHAGCPGRDPGPLPVPKTVPATGSAISHQTSAAEIEIGRRFAGIIVIGLARWLTGNLEDS